MSQGRAPVSSKRREIMRRRRRAAALRRLAAIVLIAAVVGGYLWHRDRAAPEAPPVVREALPEAVRIPQPPPPEEELEAEAVAEPAVPLPPLDESDSLVRGWTSRLSKHLELASWLVTDDLIRRFTAAVDNVAEGKSPYRHVDFLEPNRPFRVAERDGRLFTNPKSYARYDLAADVFVSLDTGASVRTYRRLKPLIDQAYRELGYADRPFDDALAQALRELLSAPIPPGEPELMPGVLSYEFLDPEIEALSPAQKQLLRMGRRNARRVQGKLRRFEAALATPAKPGA